ncbi:ABC transporter permease [Telmatospirillum siberiense]|uniref:ABC transporter permease n=1 Tax=Telmatospirillum siberiense TaxID=382514 RepID=A0A2N3PX61_9PROT|nr:ABC transporter permease subunit [Telmatospirillum siberiense]PKU24978.1 ABC transporter permease [Telmatospirillum siberiense]
MTTTTRRGPLYWPQMAFTIAVCAFLILPVALSMLAGVSLNWQRGPAGGLTLQWIEQVWALYAETVARSLAVALACLACDLALGVPLAYVLVRRQSRWTRLVEELIMLPVAVPGLATALALIILYGGLHDFRNSSAFILVGHVLFTLPFMVRSVLAVLSAIDVPTLEEGAASLGAGPFRRLATVVLPNARPGILAGSLMVVTLSIGEFNMTWMLHTPLTKTLPVGLADAYASMRMEIASAYTVVFLLMIVPALILLQLAAASASRRSKS